MFRIATFFFVAALLAGADTSWTRVKDLKTRSELRVYKKGAREPISATLDEANDDRIVVVTKNQQIAIPKEDIDGIDARPIAAPRKVNVESTSKETPPDPLPQRHGEPAVPGSSSSSNISVGGNKPNFETVYQRSDRPQKN
ncbi:MAG TPA: hypothetical protein VG273_07390 [Bryobacteraceae bacterium]|jgi:hypothetical protein|nr:hypothetical protein [Bryobacteraceae bacterium]